MNPLAAAFSLLLLATTALLAQESSPGGAIAAMFSVPGKFSNGILEVSGKGGSPNPPEWTIIARDVDSLGTIRQLTIADGHVIRDSPSVNVGQMFRNSGYIFATEITVDSDDAFETATAYAAANDKTIGAVDFVLSDAGADVDPVWSLTCHDANGTKIGALEIIATSGKVVSQKGFVRAP